MTYNGSAHTATGSATGVGNLNLSADLTLTGTTHTNAGNYATDGWTFTDPTGNYANASGTIDDVIGQATAAITVTPYNVTYNGSAHTATGSATGVGNLNLSADLNLSGTTHTSAGNYATDGWTFTDPTGNYATANGKVDDLINSAALQITASSATVPYGTVPAITPSYSGFVGSDSPSSLATQPTCTTTATSASNVGSYATSCSGAVDANYIISYKPGTLTITPAVLTVAANQLSFAYGGGDGDNDGDEGTNPMTYTITGFAPGQTAATDLTGTPRETSNTPEGGPVGSYTITMAAGTLKLKPAYSSDYTISYVSAPLIITPAVLTVTATSQSDVYGAMDSDDRGNVNRDLTYTISGFAYNQNQHQVLDGSPTETTTATATSSVGSYPITITQGSLTFDRNYSSDYTLVFVNGTITVTPAKLTVVANSYSRQINQSNPAFSYTINGFVNGDTQLSALTGAPACCTTTATTSSPAGDYAIVIAPGNLAAKNGNYTFTLVNGVLIVFNPHDHNDQHGDGDGNYRPNPQWDANNWPDPSSYSYYWGGGGGGPNINHWQ